MPRRISMAEAKRLGAVPVEEGTPLRRISREEAQRLGAVEMGSEPPARPAGVATEVPLVSTRDVEEFSPEGESRGKRRLYTMQLPEGRTKEVTQTGAPVVTPEESARLQEGDALRLKTLALNRALTAAQAGAFDFGDELYGAASAAAAHPRQALEMAAPWVGGLRRGADAALGVTRAPEEGEALRLAYQKARDAARKEIGQAEEEAGTGWKLAGMAPQLLAGGPATVGGRLLLAGATSAAQGLGASRADLTKGEAARAAKDTGGAGAVGLGLGAAGELVALPARYVARKAAGWADAALEKVRASELAKAEKAVASEYGRLGAAGRKQVTSLEDLAKMASGQVPGAEPETVAAAKAFLASPEGLAAQARATRNTMKAAPGIPREFEAQEEAYRAALAEATPEAAAERAARATDVGAVADDLGKRLWRSYGQRAILGGLGAAVGGALGGDEHGDFGAMAGLVGGGGVAPGALQMLRNVARDPRFAKVVAELLAKGARANAGAIDAAARTGGRLAAASPEEESGLLAELARLIVEAGAQK